METKYASLGWSATCDCGAVLQAATEADISAFMLLHDRRRHPGVRHKVVNLRRRHGDAEVQVLLKRCRVRV